ncbi:MAG: hypothetical protein ACFE89_10690 [Candidatus Hodarchaeota archaeon]
MIAIGATRKPTQRIRSFIKELNWVIPGSIRITRGKQGFMDYCEAAQDLGATRILLVGAFHGNPGRFGFLEYTEENWKFAPPTIILKSVQLLRENPAPSPRKPIQLYVLPDTPQDQTRAELLAQALEIPCIQRAKLTELPGESALLLVKLSHPKTLAFMTRDEQQPLGPRLGVKHFLSRPMGERKRW